jgi:hypothetical protein
VKRRDGLRRRILHAHDDAFLERADSTKGLYQMDGLDVMGVEITLGWTLA